MWFNLNSASSSVSDFKYVVDADIINMSDKARSYATLNQAKYEQFLNDVKDWNMKLSAFNTYGI